MLALALRGTFALHAGAVDVGGQSALFVGESGAGKSTLSRALGGGALPGARRIADDIVPFDAGPGGAEILPHFPQLKLPRDAQPGRLAPERMSVAAIYVLPTGPWREDDPGGSTASRSVDVRTEPLAGQSAVLALVRHSVASVLFDPPTAARHLAICAQVAGQTPIRRLAYPWGLDVLPRVCDAILADLAMLRRSPAAPA